MAINHLEQLVSEWYEFQGYFVRRNVLVGKLPSGGYECELDIVALHPSKGRLVQIEPSLDADSWARREHRFAKKFKAGHKYIPGLFKGLDLPARIEQIAVLLFASKKNRRTVGGGRIVLVSELLETIFQRLRSESFAKNAIPEHFPILRSLQIVNEFRGVVARVWEKDGA